MGTTYQSFILKLVHSFPTLTLKIYFQYFAYYLFAGNAWMHRDENCPDVEGASFIITRNTDNLAHVLQHVKREKWYQ